MSTQIIKQLVQNSSDPRLIERAFVFASEAHYGQKRLSGEDYMVHPLSTANTLSEMGLDPQTVAAGLLHDVVDDTPHTIKDIEKEFGATIAFLVNGVSKLDKLRLPHQGIKRKSIENRAADPVDLEIENLRKMFFAMAQDLRVILIKLADRLHNMRTLGALPPQRQQKIALETIEIFAPIANRLGMGEIKGQLEDLAFQYLYPKEFSWLMERVGSKYQERQEYLGRITPLIAKLIEKEDIKIADINSRAKHYWSLYQKLLRSDMNLEKIYDLVALRILVKTTEDCYKALGTIHQHFKPLPGRIKDYIAFPKPNNYRSLHTTCFCAEGKITEIQIKTSDMHREAEYGITAHWAYKEGLQLKKRGQRKKFEWVKQLVDWQKNNHDSKEFLESLKIDFFKNRIFVLTPKGDVIDLPEGATPVDFAYSVHSDIGDRCAGAKINGKMVSLDYHLNSGDVIEILVDRRKKPSHDWLEFVKTSSAKSRIKEWLKKESRPENLRQGLALLNKELSQFGKGSFEKIPQRKKEALLSVFPFRDMETLIITVGQGEVSPKEVFRVLFKESELLTPAPPKIAFLNRPAVKEQARVLVGGKKGVAIKLAKCCSPQPKDEILGYITLNRGASVHQNGCKNLLSAKQKWPQRIIETSWATDSSPYATSIAVLAEDRIGLLRDLSLAIGSLNINILDCQTKTTTSGQAAINFQLEIRQIEELSALFQKLRQIPGIKEAKKIGT